jgi:hypothetical protein
MTKNPNSKEASTANVDVPLPLTEDSEVWQKACSLLIGTRQVLAQLREEVAIIRAAHPGKPLNAPGQGERMALIEALMDTDKSLATDLWKISRSSGLVRPEEAR